jgi:small-conductance mechanosensitive channel
MPTESGGNEKGSLRWLVLILAAISILIVMAVGAYLFHGRELFQRPFLAIALVIAWLGALVGISIGSDPGRL